MSGICGHRWNGAHGGVALLAAIFVAGFAGCTGGGTGEMAENHQRASASGNVKFKGQPIPAGTVVFTNHETGIQATCPIDQGTYESESDAGPVYGKNTVNIVGLEAEGGKPQWSGKWSQDVNVDSETFAQDFEVKGEEVQPYKDIGMDEEGALYE